MIFHASWHRSFGPTTKPTGGLAVVMAELESHQWPLPRTLNPLPDLRLMTLTFLLTDVEGSTRLWEAHRQAMAGALATHDRLISGQPCFRSSQDLEEIGRLLGGRLKAGIHAGR